MDEQNMDILERIHASYYQLTAAERRVADYVLAQNSAVQFMSITQLADECGVAEATISRFCRSLKLKGFNAFKIALARQSSAAAARSPAEHPDAAASPAGRIQAVGRLAQEAVSQTLDLINPKQIEQTVALFERSMRIMCIGSGGSMIMATECTHLFSTVSPKFFAVTGSHMQMSTAANMGPGDAIVLFSYSGATTNGLEVLELARRCGIPTVLITRFHKSPAAKKADIVLRCGSNEGPFQFGSVPARVAQLVLIDALFQEYCHRNAESCEASIQRIAAALSEKHV